MKIKILMTTFLGLATQLAYSQNTVQKLNCSGSGGGYVTQIANVSIVENELVKVQLSRFSKVLPEISLEMGLKENIQGVKTATIYFPLTSCKTKSTEDKIALIACSTGISKISAELDLLSGGHDTVSLPSNFTVETYEVVTRSPYLSEDKKTILVDLSSVGAGGSRVKAVGFSAYECKK